MNPIKVNIGCGKSPVAGWSNYDNSPALLISRYPLLFKLLRILGLLNNKQIDNIAWNIGNNIEYLDASKKLKFANATIDVIYTSHMLEHLSREDALNFLYESYRVLGVNGVLRISVPDLRKSVKLYLDSDDADSFLNDLYIEAPRLKTFKEKIKLFFTGYRHHQWMYDEKSLAKRLEKVGFKLIVLQPPGSTLIQEPDGLNLHERSDSSLYYEAIK